MALTTPRNNPKHTHLAQTLRNNQTPQEKKLWYQFLNKQPMRFRRQVTIDRFIVDFYCAAAKLVIELDGSQHFTGNGPAYDAERTMFLGTKGLRVIRFTNAEIDQHFESVCAQIQEILKILK